MLAKSNDQNTLNQDIKDINIKKLKIKYFKLYVYLFTIVINYI